MTARDYLRFCGRAAVLLASMMHALVEFAALRLRGDLPKQRRAEWLHKWCAIGVRRLNVRIQVTGEPPAQGLVVSNHLSYFDILVLSSLLPCVFVSKHEVRSWPMFGWFARLSGTVFVDRSRRTQTGQVASDMAATLGEGLVVVLFPEGTSSNGVDVLPFRPALFEPALVSGAVITPACIAYSTPDRTEAHDVCWWGDAPLAPHVLRALSKPWIRCSVAFGAPLPPLADRKQTAVEARERVLELRRVAPSALPGG